MVLQKNQIGQSVTTWSVCWGDAKKKELKKGCAPHRRPAPTTPHPSGQPTPPRLPPTPLAAGARSSELSLSSAKQLLHGAKSATFFKMRAAKKDPDWNCFSIVSKERTLDFACPDIDTLLDWRAHQRRTHPASSARALLATCPHMLASRSRRYLAIASLMTYSEEPLLTEEELMERIESMLAR